MTRGSEWDVVYMIVDRQKQWRLGLEWAKRSLETLMDGGSGDLYKLEVAV